MESAGLNLWILSFITTSFILMVLTMIWKSDNPIFRFVEHTIIGASGGTAIAFYINSILRYGIDRITAGNLFYVIPIILGLLLYTRLSRNYSWISRYPMAILVGTAAGLTISSIGQTQVIAQIEASIMPLIGGNFLPIDNLIVIITLITTQIYFFFTIIKRGERSIGYLRRIGRISLMAMFGASFGGAVLTRMGVLVGQVRILYESQTWFLIPVFIAAVVFLMYLDKRVKK